MTLKSNRLPARYPVTRDGRYFVVKGRLWRCSNPNLSAEVRSELVHELAMARRAVRNALASGKDAAAARAQVDAAKRALGERGPVWWSDGAPDFSRCPIDETPYSQWFKTLT